MSWFGAAAILLMGAGGGVCVFSAISPYPKRAYHRIELGMTVDEVAAAIGAPPRADPIELKILINYPVFPAVIDVGTTVCKTGMKPEDVPRGSTLETWDWHQYRIQVIFDLNGAAVRTELIKMPTLSLFGRLRAWLGV